MLGRPQRGGVRTSSRPAESDGPDCEPDPREDAVWGARDVPYIGSPIAEEDADTGLASYAAFSNDIDLLVAPANETELVSYLADFTLGTDTAAGALALQKLAEEHHCGAILTVEPYKGLRKDISARRVAAAVERQVQQLGWAAQRNHDVQEGWELTEEYLQHSGINVEGVINQIRGRLDHEEQEKVHMEEVLGSEALQSRISSLTTEESMDLYCSYFSKDGAKERKRGTQPSSATAANRFSEDGPPNFIMVDEDVFSSKEYQYMLFNEAGMKSASRILFGGNLE
eukprot:g21064.t1